MLTTMLLTWASAQTVPTVAPPTEPEAPPRLVSSADPLGRGDDRVAKRIEALLQDNTAPYLACLSRPPDATTILSSEVKLKVDGSVRWVKVKLSSGDDDLDQCATDLLKAMIVDPPPRFADRMRVNLRWAPAPPQK